MSVTILAPIAAIIAVVLLITFCSVILRTEKKSHRRAKRDHLKPAYELRASQARAAEAAWRDQF